MSTEKNNNISQSQKQFTSLMRGLGTRSIIYQQNIAELLGIYNHDFTSVDILRETGPITAGELSKKTGLTTGSVTSLIDRLEKKGFVNRQNDPNDRRRVIIVPKYEEKEEVQQAYEPLNSAMLNLCADYKSEELELITGFLAKANDLLDIQIQQLSQGTNSSASLRK